MSGEFGSYTTGYFQDQIDTAQADLAGGAFPLTREWAKFFEEFRPIAYAISRCEAFDSGPAFAIIETIHRIDRLKKALDDVENFVRPYKEVADFAVRAAADAKPSSPPPRPEPSVPFRKS